MSLGTPNRDGGKTSESAHLRSLTKGFRGEVISGLNVSQRGAGANMSVDIAIGDAIIPRSDGTYSHPAFNDAVLNQAITTADPSNPRRDIVVMYIDYTQTPSTGVSNNTNGVVKVKVVAGTPAGSPVDPTDSAIQTSVGAGNPFIKLARARVGTGVTSIGNSVIDDMRRMATAHVQGGWLYDYLYTWVYVSATSFKITGVDATLLFPVGTKIQLYQGSVVKYFTVISAVFSTDTTVTLDGIGGLYSLTNNIIDAPAYSYMEMAQGFPIGQTLIPYKFSAYRNTAMSISGGFAAITLDTKEFDTSNNFNTSNGRFTAPVAAYYVFTGYVGYGGDSSGNHHLTTFYKNGVEVKRGGEFAFNDAANHGICATCMVYLAAGDYVQLAGYSGPSIALQTGSSTITQMAGWLLSRA